MPATERARNCTTPKPIPVCGRAPRSTTPIPTGRGGYSPTAADPDRSDQSAHPGGHGLGVQEVARPFDLVHEGDECGVDRGIPAQLRRFAHDRAVEVVDLSRLPPTDALQRR